MADVPDPPPVAEKIDAHVGPAIRAIELERGRDLLCLHRPERHLGDLAVAVVAARVLGVEVQRRGHLAAAERLALLVGELDGERIVKATPDLGYLHGVEKLAEGLAYMQIIPHTDRLDYVCAMANNYAYVRAVEKLLCITVPERAEYIRTIVAEMQRILGP